MATMYSDQHRPLKELLAMAGDSGDATLLIPDLQRPYVWLPTQVIVLVDSLIRGWPTFFTQLIRESRKPEDSLAERRGFEPSVPARRCLPRVRVAHREKHAVVISRAGYQSLSSRS